MELGLNEWDDVVFNRKSLKGKNMIAIQKYMIYIICSFWFSAILYLIGYVF